MKKNFMAIAALLVAAMLLVVSCSQEVAPKAEANNGLVEVTLNTSAARSVLGYSGMSAENANYRYKLTPKWTPATGMDAIVGKTLDANNQPAFKNFTVTENNKTQTSLGWLSQGLWEIEVYGAIDGKDVLHGITQAYINDKSGGNSVTVYLAPLDTSTETTLSFDIKVNDHDAESNGYTLKYDIVDVSGGVPKVKTAEGETDFTETALTKGSLSTDGIRTWTGSITGLKTGYYRVTVSMYRDSTKEGGITTAIVLFAGDTNAKITGTVNSKNFVEGTLSVVYPTITVSLTGATGDKATIDSSTNKASVTYTATSSISNNLNNATVKYAWYADGEKIDNNETSTYTAEYTIPGYKTVTCVAIYTFNVNTTNESGAIVSDAAFSFSNSAEITTLITK